MAKAGNIKGTLSNQEAYTETESPMRTGQDLSPAFQHTFRTVTTTVCIPSTLNYSQLRALDP